MAEEHGYTMEAGRALNNMAATLSAGDAPFSEMLRIHEESLAHAKKHGHRDDALLSRDVLYKFLEGDWDAALSVAAESDTAGVWKAGRDRNIATILVCREGPLPAHLALADSSARQLLAAGSRQWTGDAMVTATTYYAAERWAEAAAAAEPGRPLIRQRNDFGPLLQTAMVAARAARLATDQATADRWIEDLIANEYAGARSNAAAMFGKAVIARRAGTAEDAVDLLTRCVTTLEDRRAPFGKLVVRQELIELLAEAGRFDEAAAAFRALTEYWRKAKATWLLGRLGAWATGLGVPTAER